MKRPIPTSFVGDAHAYTRVKCPWIIGGCGTASGNRLVTYISGGGMRTFGRTVRQESARRRQNRFFAVAALLGVAWTVFMFV